MGRKTFSEVNYLFETSWEVCNKVGGIHTVIATKALQIKEKYGDNYIVIGPDLWQHQNNPEFTEDTNLFRSWRLKAADEGLRVRVGRWNIKGNPIAILVDFSHYNSNKSDILKFYWDKYYLDSFNSSWDYIESVLFGYAAAKVMKHFTNFHTASREGVLCHFHEWMTASGLLYLKTVLPKAGTIFTTHATVIGRCIAGNGYPLYNAMSDYNADEMAYQFGVQHKHFIEKTAVHTADCFATVSNLTAKECLELLGKSPDIVTPNGFEEELFLSKEEFKTKRKEAKEKSRAVAQALVGEIDKNAKMVAISGRYEFRNKGIDAFIDALGQINRNPENKEELIAFLLIPTLHEGVCPELAGNEVTLYPAQQSYQTYTTHLVPNAHLDAIINKLKEQQLNNSNSDKVKVIFCPSYLDGNDGVFNLNYYDVLVGMDATVFPSYYEPWGYTPLESLAFRVPSITTDKAGFGLWVEEFSEAHEALEVVPRDDNNYAWVVGEIVENIKKIQQISDKEHIKLQENAEEIARLALWKNLVEFYQKAYQITTEKITNRISTQPKIDSVEASKYWQMNKQVSQPQWRSIMVQRSIPDNLKPLEELSKNLWWCWNMNASELFRSIDSEKWEESYKNPILFLDMLPFSRYKELEKDKKFMKELKSVYDDFQEYMSKKKEMKHPSVAYFSMEYGLHSSLKIYSGGLGILAGDYLKEASDKATNITAVGLLYRYGYFTQKLSSSGNQEAEYEAQDFSKIPVTPVTNEDGSWLIISLDYPGREVKARVWRTDVGRVELYLLDTDLEENAPHDRSITHHLYGGDWENRLKQEMLLGLGGIKTLRALGIQSDVYHCNEGHAAFIGLERLVEYVEKENLSFSEAVEVVRATSLFTTHTPVPAGHDFFEEGMLKAHIHSYASRLNISWEQLLSLGKIDVYDSREKFSMSFLAANLSQEVNGVSWLHGEVSKDILKPLWPGYLPEELHISYVTNGVHQPTWTSAEWKKIQQKTFGKDYHIDNYNTEIFEKIYEIPNEEIMEVRSVLRNKLVRRIQNKLSDERNMSYFSPRQLVEIKESLRDDVLTIGFARRFATYKRAHLLFSNMERLDAIVNNPKCPVQFVFAGKAHPADKAGQDLIKHIVEVSKMPQFLGKIIFIPNYDMELAKTMIQGVDVWMNTPTRPQEASGTSGEKAVMNGVMNLSVLDGWWVEGYREDAGWALPMERTYENQHFQNELDAELIYNIIEDQIVPAFYDKKKGVSDKWVSYIKNTLVKVAMNFTTRRMLTDYENQYYFPMEKRGKELTKKNYEKAIEIAEWKQKVAREWHAIEVTHLSTPSHNQQVVSVGNKYVSEITLNIGDLSKDDIGVELVICENKNNQTKFLQTKEFKAKKQEGSKATYILEDASEMPGLLQYAVRIYPENKMLPHRQDFALVKWV